MSPVEHDRSLPMIAEFALAHAAGVRDVIRDVYAEYGFTWDDAHAYFADLHDIPGHYAARGGAFWVLLDGPRVVGSVGVSVHGDECELHRMYLLKSHRGAGHGRQLLDQAVTWSRQRGMRRMLAWSDVKLTAAHAMYRRFGFTHIGERIIDDPDQSREFGFRLNLSPIAAA